MLPHPSPLRGRRGYKINYTRMLKKTIILIGGSGFIGKNILEMLGGKYDLLAPSRTEMDLLDADSVKNYFASHISDVVIYSANVGGNKKQAHITDIKEKNIGMFMNVAGASEHFKKMIFLGSGAEYDKRRDLHLVKEEDFGRFEPSDEYGQAKYQISKYIESNENIISLRCFGVYGKYEDPDMRFISNAIKKALSGENITIFQNIFFDYLWVGDLVKIIEHFIEHKGKHKFYNACSAKPVDLLSIAETVKKISGKKIKIEIQNPGLAKEYTGDNSRLLSELPNFQLTTLEEGIGKMFEYLK